MIFIQGRFNKNVNEDDEFKQQKKIENFEFKIENKNLLEEE